MSNRPEPVTDRVGALAGGGDELVRVELAGGDEPGQRDRVVVTERVVGERVDPAASG